MIYVLILLLLSVTAYIAYSSYMGLKYGALHLPEAVIKASIQFSEHRTICNGITYFTFDCTKILTVEYVSREIINIYIRDMSNEMREYVLQGIEGMEINIESDTRSRISQESYLKIIERLCEYFKDTKYPLRVKHLSPLMPE